MKVDLVRVTSGGISGHHYGVARVIFKTSRGYEALERPVRVDTDVDGEVLDAIRASAAHPQTKTALRSAWAAQASRRELAVGDFVAAIAGPAEAWVEIIATDRAIGAIGQRRSAAVTGRGAGVSPFRVERRSDVRTWTSSPSKARSTAKMTAAQREAPALLAKMRRLGRA